ncbi:PH domain-containing protein [Rhizobium leguminosarum bv. trifolii]|nr:PH domain-containing protein [Rhizobium leguminosarum bv. trifolii]
MGTSDIQSYFMPGEKLLWSGRPVQGFRLTPWDLLLVPFSLFWGGFAIFWEMSVMNTVGTPVLMRLWGIPFVLIGLYLIAGRFVVDAAVRARTEYDLTDRRVIIRRSGPLPNFSATQLELLPSISLAEDSHGRGTIKFSVPSNQRYRMASVWTPSLSSEPQLLAIDGARQVYNLLEKARFDCRGSR